jgi:hypothetical protein
VPVAKTLNPAAAAFIPVIPTQAQPKETAPRLEIRFPNGIKVGFDDARDDQLLTLLTTLSTLPCFDSTKAREAARALREQQETLGGAMRDPCTNQPLGISAG